VMTHAVTAVTGQRRGARIRVPAAVPVATKRVTHKAVCAEAVATVEAGQPAAP
jgi:hypothetical protein